MSPPSIKDVARESGVSYKTVSRVVNGEPDVSPATRQRVQTAIATLGYRPHQGARGLRHGRTQTLRLVMPKGDARFLANPFQDEVIAGVADTASRLGYGVLLELIVRDNESAALPGLLQRRVDGTVLLDSRRPEPYLLPALRAAGEPCVVLANRDLDPGIAWIDADFEDGAERLVRHLLDLGHRRIAHVTDNPALRSTQGRRDGYERALRSAGITPDPDLTVVAGQYRHEGEAATTALLARGHPFTAIFCVNDLTASGAIDALRFHGLRVPEDVSVTGYDDIALARFTAPPLTTAHLPWYEMGAAGVELVIGAIEGTRAFPEGITFPATLCHRGSTGKVGSQQSEVRNGQRVPSCRNQRPSDS